MEHSDIAMPCYKTKKPKMSSHRGRTWDCVVITIDGDIVDFHLDTTWGQYVYFVWEGDWYKMRMVPDVLWFSDKDYVFDPFDYACKNLLTCLR